MQADALGQPHRLFEELLHLGQGISMPGRLEQLEQLHVAKAQRTLVSLAQRHVVLRRTGAAFEASVCPAQAPGSQTLDGREATPNDSCLAGAAWALPLCAVRRGPLGIRHGHNVEAPYQPARRSLCEE